MAARHVVEDDGRRWTITLRILRRFKARRRAPEVGGRGTLMALLDELRWSADYYGQERRMLFDKVGRWPGKLVVLRGREYERALAEVTAGT